MEAIIIDINDHRPEKPEQTVNAFFSVHTPASVKTRLWQIFMANARVEQKGSGNAISETEVALLFDDLCDLLTAVQTLQDRNRREAGS